ncbi:hypothetical protein Ciccas_001711 [Cichlidogyrus casuarinus]|uniref:Uncharacterized protein n=1 Tax=Cichlidogyrus casuarinus TaxID=1844966 RepID=A0ABD2QJC7_9PLAT
MLSICLPDELVTACDRWLEQNSDTTFETEKLLTCDNSRNAYAFLTTKLGMSFLCFLLDACACHSSPDDPGDFIVWSIRLAKCVSTTPENEEYRCIETQTRLCNILVTFLEPLTKKEDGQRLPRAAYDRLMSIIATHPDKPAENVK